VLAVVLQFTNAVFDLLPWRLCHSRHLRNLAVGRSGLARLRAARSGPRRDPVRAGWARGHEPHHDRGALGAPSRNGRRAMARRRAVQLFVHLRCDAFLLERLLVFPAQEWVFEPIGNGGATLGDVDRPLVGILLAGHAGLVLAMIVGTVPTDQAQRLLADAEMGVEPVTAVRRSGDQADRLVILPVDVLRL